MGFLTFLITIAFSALPQLAARFGMPVPYDPQPRLMWLWAGLLVTIFFVRFVAAQRMPPWRVLVALILGLAVSLAIPPVM